MAVISRYSPAVAEQRGLGPMLLDTMDLAHNAARRNRSDHTGKATAKENRDSGNWDEWDDDDEAIIENDDVVLKGKRIRSDQLVEPKPVRARDMGKLAELCNRSASGLKVEDFTGSSGSTGLSGETSSGKEVSSSDGSWLGPILGDPVKKGNKQM